MAVQTSVANIVLGPPACGRAASDAGAWTPPATPAASRSHPIRYAATFTYRGYTQVVRRKLCNVIPAECVRFGLFGTRQTRRYLCERLGWLPASARAVSKHRPIWIHANSYGEVLASEPLLQAMRQRWSGVPVVVSTTNFTADTEAHRLPECAGVFFVPYDSPGIVARVLAQLRPRGLVFVEADLWPNLLRACTQRAIPVVLVSGRYMDLRYWFNWRFPLTQEVLQHVAQFCMQSDHDAERLRALAPKARMQVTGNLKVDRLKQLGVTDAAALQPWREGFRLTNASPPVWVAGSVHPGEDELVFEAYLAARRIHPALTLLLAPRYLEHVARCEQLAKDRGLQVFRRSAMRVGRTRIDEDVILLDTLGELSWCYALGTVTFVGGSLVPDSWAPRGFECEGHNPLEPVAWGKLALFGPRMGNFAALAKVCLDAGVGWQVENAEQLAQRVAQVIGDATVREDVARRSRILLAHQPSVAQQTLDAIAPVMKGDP